MKDSSNSNASDSSHYTIAFKFIRSAGCFNGLGCGGVEDLW